MTPARRPTNVAASVRARLLDLSRTQGVEFQLLLSEFAIERLLYRLGVSANAEQFVLKGATLFRLWSDDRGRATWDLDLLGRGANTVAGVVTVIRDLCGVGADDGIVFDSDSVKGEDIRATEAYAGVRVRLDARLAEARIPVQVDVGFGDAIVPAPTLQTYPTLLEHPAPRILVYPRETVVAEKLEAMASLGVTNSRMKDYYDVHRLAQSSAFDGASLARAIRATFDRRRTPFPETVPLSLAPGFLAAPERQTQWRAFLRRGRLDAPPGAGHLAEELRAFLLPVLAAAARGGTYRGHWPPGGPWMTDSTTGDPGLGVAPDSSLGNSSS
jgi:predicted nucleotidyltransferase component of viral defense system